MANVQFRDVVKKYAGTDEALGVPAGTVGGIPVVTPDDLGPAAAMTPAEVVTDEDAQAALSATFGRQSTPIPQAVSTPTGFSWTDHPLAGKLFVDQHGIFTTTLDPTDFKAPAGVTYYVDLAAGNDSNDGLTEGTALQRLYTAIEKPDVGTIMLKGYANNATPYYRQRGTAGFGIAKSLNIIGYGDGMPCITTHDLLSWSPSPGMANTYEATRSGVHRVMDMIDGASGVELRPVGSVAAVEEIPGSWYTDGTTVYVHPSTARPADSYIWAFLSTVNIEVNGDHHLYMEGVKVFGGSDGVRINGASAAGGMLVLNGCEVHCSTNGTNAVTVVDSDAIIVDTLVTLSDSDGISYTSVAGHPCRAIEVGVRSLDSGHSTDDQNSTMHAGGSIIRVNGVYRRAFGANIADVNNGTETWMLGCVAEDSVRGWNIKIGNDSGTPRAWLDGCQTGGARWSIYAHGTAEVHTRATRADRVYGSVTAY